MNDEGNGMRMWLCIIERVFLILLWRCHTKKTEETWGGKRETNLTGSLQQLVCYWRREDSLSTCLMQVLQLLILFAKRCVDHLISCIIISLCLHLYASFTLTSLMNSRVKEVEVESVTKSLKKKKIGSISVVVVGKILFLKFLLMFLIQEEIQGLFFMSLSIWRESRRSFDSRIFSWVRSREQIETQQQPLQSVFRQSLMVMIILMIMTSLAHLLMKPTTTSTWNVFPWKENHHFVFQTKCI